MTDVIDSLVRAALGNETDAAVTTDGPRELPQLAVVQGPVGGCWFRDTENRDAFIAADWDDVADLGEWQ